MKKCYCVNPEYKKNVSGGGKVYCLKCGGLILEAVVVGDASGAAQPTLAGGRATPSRKPKSLNNTSAAKA